MSAAKKKKIETTIKDQVIHIRAVPSDKNLIEQAADYLGLSISSFMLQNSIKAARKELISIESENLSKQDAAIFLTALSKPKPANAALKSAFKSYLKHISKNS